MCYSGLSLFWTKGLSSMIDYFNNIDKLLAAFYPLFKKWWLTNKKALMKVADHCVTIKRSQLVPGCQSHDFKQWCKSQAIKRTKPSPTNMHPDYSHASAYLYRYLNTNLEFSFQKDILQHFSTLLSTDAKQVELTFDCLKEKVTPTRRYTSLPNTMVCLDPDFKETSNTHVVDGIANAPNVQTDALVAPLPTSLPEQTAVIVSPKKRPPSDKSHVQSHVLPIPKKSQSPLHTWPAKLVLDAFLAKPDNSEFTFVQSATYLALKSTLTGDALFDAFTRHCSSGNEHLVLVSRPFKSVTERVAGLPLLVRQVHMLTLLCSPVIITLTLRVLFSEKNSPTLSLVLCVQQFEHKDKFRVDWFRSSYKGVVFDSDIDMLWLQDYKPGMLVHNC